MTYALWIVQALLAMLFFFGGVFKLVMPLDPIIAQTGLSGSLIRFVAVCSAAWVWCFRESSGFAPG